jgi:hypothetical protein
MLAARARIAAVACALVVGAAVAPAQAQAQQYDIVGILALEADGVSQTAAAKLEAGIEEGIAGTSGDEHPRVATRQRLNEMLAHSKFDPGCRFGPCLEEIYKNTKVRMVLVGRIASSGPSYNFLVSMMDTRTGLLMSQVSTRCAVCTLDEAIASATLATIELITQAESGDQDPAAVTASSLKATAELASERKRTAAGRRATRRTAFFFLSAALLAGGAGAYFTATDDGDVGYPLLAASGAFAVTSTALFVLSRKF